MSYVPTTKCRSCGKLITFIKTRSGKSMPCDAEQVRFVPDLNGKNLYVLEDGSVIHGALPRPDDSDIETGYISHYATCPEADRFRRPGKKSRKAEALREGDR